MATMPSTGPISINDFNTGMAGGYNITSGSARGLNDSNIRAIADKASGIISLADLRGKIITRPVNPIVFASPLISSAYGASVIGYYKIRFEIQLDGYIICQATRVDDSIIETYQTNFLLSYPFGENVMQQFDISVSRTAWNGLGVVTGNVATNPWGGRGNFIISVQVSGSAKPDATYVLTLTDRFNPSNTVSKTIQLVID